MFIQMRVQVPPRSNAKRSFVSDFFMFDSEYAEQKHFTEGDEELLNNLYKCFSCGLKHLLKETTDITYLSLQFPKD